LTYKTQFDIIFYGDFMDISKVGETIKFLRNKNTNLSQEEFAVKVGLDRTYLSRVESGQKNITLETLNEICNGLGVTITEFFLVYDEMLPIDSEV